MLMNAKEFPMDVIKMPNVPILEGVIYVPAEVDIREMDSLAQVQTKYTL